MIRNLVGCGLKSAGVATIRNPGTINSKGEFNYGLSGFERFFTGP